MRCDKCHEMIEAGEERELHGRLLCEDCYMDALSPPRACDPWAVHTAKTTLKTKAQSVEINKVQSQILEILKESDGIEPAFLVDKLHMKASDLEREIAALRHMEKVRGELRKGKKILCLW